RARHRPSGARRRRAARPCRPRRRQRRRRRHRRRAHARGDADMTTVDAIALVERELDRAAAPCVTSSFQAECVVLVDIVRRRRPDVPILFLDTVHHFAETTRYAAELASAWHLNLVTLRAADPAPGLWRESTQACCARHKVEPLFSALK